MRFNTEALRDLLCEAFSHEDLYTLCYDHFPEVCRNLSPAQSQTARAQALIEYCDRAGKVDELLHIVKEKRLNKFTEFESRLGTTLLDPHLEEVLKLALSTNFERDKYAKLDQAGETDPDRTTLLRQVFVDLEVKPREGPQPRRLRRRRFSSSEEPDSGVMLRALGQEETLSAMNCLLQERWSMVVLIGGPGQGKSTLSQYITQVHRAGLLGRREELRHNNIPGQKGRYSEFTPKVPRVPFRIVLKYLAQWLADGPRIDSVEAYMADQMGKDASRNVALEDVQTILRSRPVLVVFDGLDEVIEPELRKRLLARLHEFLARAEEVHSDLQVLATSRPTGYSDQFDPERFWHLELQPMSVERVGDYAERWVRAKVSFAEERRRVLDTIRDCQQEEHTKLLLTTPLQVTIVLLIIKDGGRPPAQREALFNEYWTTIFRREKAKAKGVIRTEEQLLFDLHAYLGYLLQRRAATKSARALLPKVEFQQTVYSFLRAKDRYSPEEVIKQRSAEMIREASDRLVLLVSPEPDLFGFELRSLQEFFAAAYLAQTAQNTEQRFARLKAIACSEHWRNVALFFAGRIVRSFSGEAANILELVCRPIDRGLPDRYLKRGAWLALDIAADGAFAANRDLQYSAIEYGLTVLETGMANTEAEHLKAALRRLSSDDQRDILKPIWTQQLISLPAACLARGLDAYGAVLATDQTFIKGLEFLLGGSKSDIRSAINLGIQYLADPPWLATQLSNHWSIWIEASKGDQLWQSWTETPDYIQQVLLSLSLSASSADEFMRTLRGAYWGSSYAPFVREHAKYTPRLPTTLTSPAHQILALFQCLDLLDRLERREQSSHQSSAIGDETATIGFFEELDDLCVERLQIANQLGISDIQVAGLLQLPKLLPQLRACLWCLYWTIHTPTVAETAVFLDEVRTWLEFPGLRQIIERWLKNIWPLLGLAVEFHIKGDHERANRLRPYLSREHEDSINRQVCQAVRQRVQGASKDGFSRFMQELLTGEINSLLDLAPVAEMLGLTISEVVACYTSWRTLRPRRYSLGLTQHAISLLHKVAQRQEPNWLAMWLISGTGWLWQQETRTEAKELLANLINTLPKRPKTIILAIPLFLKLLAIDEHVLQMAPALLAAVGHVPDSDRKVDLWEMAGLVEAIPSVRLSELIALTSSTDPIIQDGALYLSEIMADALVSGRTLGTSVRSRKGRKFGLLRFDWKIGSGLIDDASSSDRLRGITLLTLSSSSSREAARYSWLLSVIAKASDEKEVAAWARLLRCIAIPAATKAPWCKLLESLLDQVRAYPSAIVTAAAERYAALTGETGSDIIGDEVALGLAPASLP